MNFVCAFRVRVFSPPTWSGLMEYAPLGLVLLFGLFFGRSSFRPGGMRLLFVNCRIPGESFMPLLPGPSFKWVENVRDAPFRSFFFLVPWVRSAGSMETPLSWHFCPPISKKYPSVLTLFLHDKQGLPKVSMVFALVEVRAPCRIVGHILLVRGAPRACAGGAWLFCAYRLLMRASDALLSNSESSRDVSPPHPVLPLSLLNCGLGGVKPGWEKSPFSSSMNLFCHVHA